MKKAIILAIAFSFLLPFLAFSEKYSFEPGGKLKFANDAKLLVMTHFNLPVEVFSHKEDKIVVESHRSTNLYVRIIGDKFFISGREDFGEGVSYSPWEDIVQGRGKIETAPFDLKSFPPVKGMTQLTPSDPWSHGLVVYVPENVKCSFIGRKPALFDLRACSK